MLPAVHLPYVLRSSSVAPVPCLNDVLSLGESRDPTRDEEEMDEVIEMERGGAPAKTAIGVVGQPLFASHCAATVNGGDTYIHTHTE